MTFDELLLSRVHNMGRVQERLDSILGDDIFYSLGNNNEYWHSDEESVSQKLNEVRLGLRCLRDNLWDIMGIIKPEGDE